ncbi:MAG: hypothetical protein JNN07_17295 [Verrucomicrobiales bacterium]|nr:hypothetical protein [Verrucomicrobiales bacterium]
MKNDTRKQTVGKNGSATKPDSAKLRTSSSSGGGRSGVGAVGGAAAGAVLGAVAGPVGAAVGLVAGAVAGALAGKRVARGTSASAARDQAKSISPASSGTAKSSASDSAAIAKEDTKKKKSTGPGLKRNSPTGLGSANGVRKASRTSQLPSAPKRQVLPAGKGYKSRSRPVAGR